MFITGKRNAVDLAPAPNDYVLVFQKPGELSVPVQALFDEKKNPGGWVTTNEWVRDAHGIWTDILETDVLDGYRAARESSEEKHVCPLQLEVIRRLVNLYSNPISIQPDVLVLDPFAGIGSTGYICLGGETAQGHAVGVGPRNFVGFELKETYHDQALRNVALAHKHVKRRDEDARPLLAGVE
jgi:DNA modification methylase